MAELTNNQGMQFLFDPKAVSAIADRDADTGEAVTVVYGLTAGPLRMAEPVDAFLNRVGLTPVFAKLTRPNGSAVWISCKGIKVARPPLADEYAPAVRSVLALGTLLQGVAETLAEVRQAVNAHGGSL
jgi:hypothetical protein